jgi:transcription initiation factor TFIIIB Brf1 subunit/transcription initiation factor TFIIB
MTRADIIRMAEEAGLTWVSHNKTVIAFANLVAASKQEDCAKLCDDMVLYGGQDCATAIRSQS